MRRFIAAILALGALMGLSAVFSPAALADGDPASDVLLYDAVFNPPNSGATPQQYAQLSALVTAVSKAGYPIKVALIASESDLGTVTQLWNQPNNYGTYLGKELSDAYGGTVLVVMPDGYGLFKNVPLKKIPAGDFRVMDSDSLGAPGSDLVAGAYNVVLRLAKANNVPIPARLNVQSTAASSGSSSAAPWIMFIAGLVLIAGAWAVSLRLRPVRRKVLA